MALSDFGFYAVLTSPVRGYAFLTELLVDYGVAFVQLRMKDAAHDEILATAQELAGITEKTSTRFIVNDFPDIARAIGADGVHIGQSDMSYSEARRIVGPDSIIGISTHSPVQTVAACALKPDYIGIGPVFPTPTKKNPDPVIGLKGMKEMIGESNVPAVAIGGIDLKNLPDVLAAGARNFCMVRQLTQAEDPGKVLKEIQLICEDWGI